MSINIMSNSGWLTAPSCMCQAMAAAHGLALLGKASCKDGFVPYDDAGHLTRHRAVSIDVVSSAALGRHVRAFGGDVPSRFRRRHLVDRIEADLRDARGRIADGAYAEAIPILQKRVSDLEAEAAKGTMLCGRWLSYLYSARVMLKAAERHDRMFREGSGKSSVQVLLIDSGGERVLLQRRGLFKRLFPDTYTVSANAKPAPGEEAKPAAAKAVKTEVGIEIDPARFEMIGEERGHENYLVSFDFHAFSKAEEAALESALSEMEMPRGIRMNYNILKRSLTVLTTDPEVSRDEVRRTADSIAERTGVRHIHPVFDRDRNSLMVCRLTKGEEALVRANAAENIARKGKALAGLGGGVDGEMLLAIDSDDMSFVHWLGVRRMFKSHPHEFALDLAGPCLGSDSVWEAMEMGLLDVIRACDPAAALPFVSGGKGSNTHFLLELAGKIPGLSIPETSVIPAGVFRRIVFDDPEIRGQIELLDRARSRERKREIAAGIRERIGRIELPEDVSLALEEEFRRLGGDVAVRSSANSEDMGRHMAAGQADSFMHQITVEGVIQSVLKVWQSLYSDGFVQYRESIGFSHSEARMAVLLQEFVSPKAAGVVVTFDQGTGRPIYRVTAQPGHGEGVVEGVGAADRWLVGLTGEEILEKEIAKKRVRFVEDAHGGLRRESVSIGDPSLEDGEVLRLVEIAKGVHRAYREAERADHVDIEYLVDGDGRIVIVQARPKASGIEIDKRGNKVLRYTTIDTERIPPGSVADSFYDRAQVAYPGVAIGRLQVLHGTSADATRGSILLAHHTNNEFNGVFASFPGIITTDGDTTSHAGQHAFEKRIPCIVGARGAFGLMERYDGEVITFDASAKMFVLGACPLKEVEAVLSVWHADEAAVRTAESRKDRHEIFRPWGESKEKRGRVFVEDLEGHWRRRSNAYGRFQLDYYYRAWDVLTETLESMFAGRSPWKLEAQQRAIKAEEDGSYLWHAVREDDPRNIYRWLTGVASFGIADCERLFEARWNGFRKFADFMGRVSSIDRSNVSGVVDNLIEIFSWMHFGFWLDSVVDGLASRQLRHISDDGAFHSMLRSEAVAGREETESIDPLRPDVPPGRVLYLSRNKDREIYAVLESIRENPLAVRAFGSSDPVRIREELMAAAPEIYRKIDAWSMRYKSEKEHLDHLSDTGEYLKDLKERIENASVPSPGMLANFYRAYISRHGKGNATIGGIGAADPEFYLMLRGRARLLAARASDSGWYDMSMMEQGEALIKIDAAGVGRFVGEALREVEQAHAQEDGPRQSAKMALDAYPELKRTMALYEMQLALREDGHHLIVPHQRRIARMMLDAAGPFVPSVLSRPQDVFEIGTDEFAALLTEADPSYIKATFRRNRMLEEAELEMVRQWSVREEDLAALTDRPSQLIRALVDRGYLNIYGAMQDKAVAMRDAGDMALPDEFQPISSEVYEALRGRVAGVPSKIKAYALAVERAAGILRRQEARATLGRAKGHYRRESERLKERAERLLRLADRIAQTSESL